MGARHRLIGMIAVGLAAGFGALALAEPPEPPAADAGRRHMTEKAFLRPTWKAESYKNVRRFFGPDAPDPEKDPAGYAAAFNARYGFHPAPYPNDGLPMGLKRGVRDDGTRAGITVDCLECHGGSIGGTSIVGLGNTQLDLTLFFDEMMAAEGRKMPPLLFTVNSVRGNNNAGTFSAVLLSLRNPDLSPRLFPLALGANFPELDVPPWWHLRKKSTMYYDGRTSADSARSIMQFLLGEKSLQQFKDLEPTFREIHAFLKSIEPPKYPFEIDRARADRGRVVFETTCSKCHGTYGPDGEYPNEIIPLKVIGTDPARALGASDRLVAHYNSTWFAEHHPADPVMVGYQAPPLDGIWATAPYLHNGSVPTLHHLLDSPSRPSRFLRPPSTDFAHYDKVNVGWKFEPVDSPQSLGPDARRSFYDSSRFGLGNGGHTFGDKLSESDRMDLIEYLKTL